MRGDFKYYDVVTRLAGGPAGPTTITHHGEYVPRRWVPPMLGPSLIEAETRKQYTELLTEMERRAAARQAPSK